MDFKHKTKLHCRFACMGKRCKHENYQLCQNPAINGLHSNWVINLLIGSQRLSDRLIHEHAILS